MALYLVTGGAGFIGSHLTELLIAAGHEVRVFDDLSTGKRSNLPENTQFIEGDIRDVGALNAAMQGVAGCFHLAAIASVDKSNTEWLETHHVNLSGTINVFKAAREASCVPVVFASSAAVYGSAPNPPINEEASKEPISAYGADKLGCEHHAVPAWQVHGVPSTALRLFNVYGPRQDPSSPYSGVISIFANRLLSGTDLTIHGDGSQTRDFIYVSDVCEAFLAAMQNTVQGYSTYNVCTGTCTSIIELAELLAEIIGSQTPFKFGPSRAGDIHRSFGDNSRLKSNFGVNPKVDLETGLSRLIAASRSQFINH